MKTQIKTMIPFMGRALSALVLATTLTYGAAAQTYRVLHNFGGPEDGTLPVSGLVLDEQGNLYGQTQSGGLVTPLGCPHGCGVVYELSPAGNGDWNETVLHRFNGQDGSGSTFLAPVFDSRGNLYSATGNTVFELSPTSNGQWSFASLYTFHGNDEGAVPSGVTFWNGVLYGTTSWGGGENDEGTVFTLTRTSPVQWQHQIIHAFNVYNDGWLPTGLIFDAEGNAYGTTFYGGPGNNGTVYKLTRNPQTGQWSETFIHEFAGADGANPASTLIFDSAGNLYSTALTLGPNGGGTVFELVPNANGRWSIKVLYGFETNELPYGSVSIDAQGNLYGVTWESGYLYKLSPSSGGYWNKTILQNGIGNFGNVVLDAAGNIYGTVAMGGEYGKGFVWEVSP